MVKQFFENQFAQKRVCLLGYGREGKSSYLALRKFVSYCDIVIADSNPAVPEQFKEEFGADQHVAFYCGAHYTEALPLCDVVIKSPGVSPAKLYLSENVKTPDFTSQTAIFLQLFRKQVVGITGTKGKSTTVSLLYHIFCFAGKDVLLAGNIGVPPFEMLDRVKNETVVVFEMSSHQLEGCPVSPAMAVLLNIFQEHLDHYKSYRDYQLAKLNIARWQQPGDTFICNISLENIRSLVAEMNLAGTLYSLNYPVEGNPGVWCEDADLIINDEQGNQYTLEKVCVNRKLPGRHNLNNVAAAALAAHLHGVKDVVIQQAVASFEGLPHRLELVRNYKGVSYYNDSISTIPESTIEAIKTLSGIETLLVGGFDRGIDYSVLTEYLRKNPVKNLLLIGEAGKRINSELGGGVLDSQTGYRLVVNDFEEAVLTAVKLCTPGSICLLSPAAASYDMFRNFEERGEKFRQIILGLKE